MALVAPLQVLPSHQSCQNKFSFDSMLSSLVFAFVENNFSGEFLGFLGLDPLCYIFLFLIIYSNNLFYHILVHDRRLLDEKD